ncbi:MAG: CopG family transcriptional regulator [Synergistaceae bacterium]|nr:CopG family transcriptional regulator [Synergistaceae bacterium]
MLRIAFIGAILDEPERAQVEFNSVVSSFRSIVRSRCGNPFPEGVAVVSLVVMGEVDQINALTGRLGQIPNVQVKSAISKKEFQ